MLAVMHPGRGAYPAVVARPLTDRCPGVLRLHQSGDGLLARVRLPGVWLSRSGTRMSTRAIDLVIRRLAAEAGLQLSAHVLRHTCVTNLIRSGADVVMVAEIAVAPAVGHDAPLQPARRPTRTRRWKPSSSRPDGPAGRLDRA
jgi:integrase